MAAKVFGLILAGGKSSRMGMDKGTIEYHGKPQREYLYELLNGICDATYMSVRADQRKEVASHFQTIVDSDHFPGPFNGLLSAHECFPEVAWLVVATDLPFLSLQDLQLLLTARNPDKGATAFASRNTALPEPLCCIWEPRMLREARQHLEKGEGNSPRKFLISKAPELVYTENDLPLLNANTPEDYKLVVNQMRQHEF